MAVPVIESYTTYEDAGNATSRTIAKPSGFTTGDWLILINGMDGTSAVTASDFTIIRDVIDSEGSSRMTLGLRKYTGSEGSTFTVGSASETGKGYLARVSGIDSSATTSDIIDALSVCKADCTDTFAFAPQIYTQSNDALVFAAYVMDGGIANAAATGIPSGYTEQYQDAGISTGVGMSVVTKSAASSGYVAGAAFTASVSTDAYACMHFALRSSLTNQSLPAQPVLKCLELYQPTSTTAAVVLDVPYGTVEDDGLLGHVCTDAGDYLSPPADFATVQTGVVGVSTIRMGVYEFVADASMPTDYTFTTTATASKIGALKRFINIDPANFVDNSSVATGTSTTPTASTITPTVDNCFIDLAYAADDSNGVTTNANFFASSTGLYTLQSIAGGDTSLSSSYKTQTTATATGSISATIDASQEWVATAVAIAPLVSGTTYNDTIGEAVTVGYSTAEVLTVNGGYSESVTPGFTTTQVLTVEGAYSESVTPGQTFTPAATYENNNVSEGVTPDYTLSPELVIPTSLTESLTPGYSTAEVVTCEGAYSEAVTPASTFAVVVTVEGAVSESVTPGYSLADAQTLVGAYSESVTPAYSVDAIATMEGGYSESITVDGTFAASALVMNDTLSESVTVGGDFGAAAEYNNNSISDSVTVGYDTTAVMTFDMALSEGVTAGESLAAAATMNGSLSEGVTVGESSSVTFTVEATLSEGVTPGESSVCVPTFNASCTETITVTDTFAAVATMEGAVSEGVTPDVTLLDAYTGSGGGGTDEPDYRSAINSPIMPSVQQIYRRR